MVLLYDGLVLRAKKWHTKTCTRSIAVRHRDLWFTLPLNWFYFRTHLNAKLCVNPIIFIFIEKGSWKEIPRAYGPRDFFYWPSLSWQYGMYQTSHILVIFQSSLSHLPVISQSSPIHLLVISQSYPSHLTDNSQ